jgi:hypothetical protein
MIVAFSDKACPSERETVREALKSVREVKRSAMSGAQSATSLQNRWRIYGTRESNANLRVQWHRHTESGITDQVRVEFTLPVYPLDWKFPGKAT